MNVQKYLIVAIAYIMGTSSVAYAYSAARIVKIQNLSSFSKEVQKSDRGVLVIFDIDDVIFTAEDQILKSYNKEYKNLLEEEIQNRIPRKEAENLWGIILGTSHYKVVEPPIIQLIKDLQKKNVRVMGLTNILTGSLGNVVSIEDWDLKRLKEIDINFEKSWNNIKEIKFKNVSHIRKKGNFPVFKRGVLFTAGASKGEILKIFLTQIKMKPKKIIFIDDKLKNLEAVQAFTSSEKIEFSGYEYTATHNLEKKPLNQERARYQFKILEKQHKWLSDEEADSFLYGNYCGRNLQEIFYSKTNKN